MTELGKEEAARGGKFLKAEKFEFDVAYTSVLKRAIKTCWLALEELDQMYIPINNDWRLNERHYGALTALNKAETTAKHGEALVTQWRRSYDIPPPPMEPSNDYWPGKDRRYASLPGTLPVTESLATTGDRVLPFWNSTLVPLIKSGKRMLIVAHGNSLRALVKHIDGISKEAITELNLPTCVADFIFLIVAIALALIRVSPFSTECSGVPLVYQFDEHFKPIRSPEAIGLLSGRYVGDQNAIRAEIEKVANQSKKKA